MTNRKEWNVGIGILKCWMCFEVVMCHCFSYSEDANFFVRFLADVRNIAVPVFMIISFFLFSDSLSLCKSKTMIKRIRRLATPLIGWAIGYYLLKLFFCLFVETEKPQVVNIVWQIITGHSSYVNPAMWFLTVQIVLVVIFWIVGILLKEKAFYAHIVLAGLAVAWEYSDAFRLLDSFRYEIKYPLGRLAPMLLCAVVGYFAGKRQWLDMLKEKWKESIFAFLIVIYLIKNYAIFSSIDGWGYQGVGTVLKAFMAVAIFYLLPLEKMPSKAKNVIKQMTRYTLGIYCLHNMVFLYLDTACIHWKINFRKTTLWPSVIVYIICYIVCCLSAYLFRKIRIIKDMFE